MRVSKRHWRSSPRHGRRTQRFSHSGRFWTFNDIVVEPPTTKKPHPPIWMAAGSPSSIRRVAERGYNLILDQFAGFEVIAERIALYKAEVQHVGAPLIRWALRWRAT